ncbi:LuxR C-terminal-related transcriptional regulator [Kitasatospora sp. NPDC015120]|uniref:LuxR C-terminal-related transcriptional regulator n=1 Tax=Kitasatospora sp. NPDC015120 TaxID=3364023 RepID=UPI0036F4AC1B
MTAVDDALDDLRTSASRLGSLSDRQEEVLHLPAPDRSGQQAADHLGITGRTVKTHGAAPMDRLGVEAGAREKSRTDERVLGAVEAAYETRLIEQHAPALARIRKDTEDRLRTASRSLAAG